MECTKLLPCTHDQGQTWACHALHQNGHPERGVETWDCGTRRRRVEELRSLILGIVSSFFVLRDGANTCATLMPCPRASQAGWSTEHATATTLNAAFTCLKKSHGNGGAGGGGGERCAGVTVFPLQDSSSHVNVRLGFVNFMWRTHYHPKEWNRRQRCV